MRPIRSVFLILFLAFAVACGASQRTKTLDTTTLALRAAYAGFHDFDEQHQVAIKARVVAESKSYEDGLAAGEAALNAWRAKRDIVKDAVISALMLVALARVETNTPLTEIAARAATAYAAIDQLKQEASR